MPRNLAVTVGSTAPGGGGGVYPDASNTGVPSGTTLNMGWHQYDFYGAADGAIYDGYDITCSAPLEPPVGDAGKTITFRNCRFTDGGVYWLVLNEGTTKLVFEHCTFLGNVVNTANDAALNGSHITLRYCDISLTGDGMKVASDVVIENCYIHDLNVTATSHNDCLQSLGTAGTGVEGTGLRVYHSTLNAFNGATCITLSTGSASDMRDVLVEDCLLYCNGFAVNGGYEAGVDTLSKVSDIIYRNNKVKNGSFTPVFTATDSPVVVTGTTWYDGPNAGQPVS